MELTKYKEKRNFKESPEPTGGTADIEKLRFVIQKHELTSLQKNLTSENTRTPIPPNS